MKISHHPSEELYLDYVSGALSEGWSLAIATHLALCPECRRDVALIEGVAGSLLEGVVPETPGESSFDSVLARISGLPMEPAAPEPAPSPGARRPVLPQPLRGYLGGDAADLQWQRLGLGAYQIIIPTGDGSTTARLLRIPAGRPVPEHSHGGLELTLVLSGAFSDSTGRYARGDLQEADEELQHQPHADAGEDCICLAVTDAPLRFRSFVARLVQPLLRI